MARFFRLCTVVAAFLHFSAALECGEYTSTSDILHSRIVNGELAVQGEFPWQVSIQRRARARVQGAGESWDPSQIIISQGQHQPHHEQPHLQQPHHEQPTVPQDPIMHWPSAEEILDATLWGKYFWAKLTPQNHTFMDGYAGGWPPPLPTHSPSNTIPPLPTHPPGHNRFPSMPPVPTFPPSGQWPPSIHIPGGGGWPPPIPGIPPSGQWPPPLPTYPPGSIPTFPPMPTFPPSIPSRPPSIPSIPSRPPTIPSIPSRPPTIPSIPSRPPSIPSIPNYPPPSRPTQPPTIDDPSVGGPNDPIQPVQPFPTRPPTHFPQPQPQPRPPAPFPPAQQPPLIPRPPQQPVQPPSQGPVRPPPPNPNEKWQHFCGGSIIDKQWILTAAHCIQPMGNTFQPGQLRIVAGSVDWRNYDPVNAQVISVDRIVYHTSWTQQAGQHDIALLHLSQPVEYVKKEKIYVNKICLSNQISSEHTGVATSSGWGFLDKNQRQTPDALRKVDIALVNHESCRNSFAQVIGISQMQVCAGGTMYKGNCMGDSGSPLIQKTSGQRKASQIGIVSFSIPCATPGYPDVFTRVSKYLDWIISHTGLSLQQLIH